MTMPQPDSKSSDADSLAGDGNRDAPHEHDAPSNGLDLTSNDESTIPATPPERDESVGMTDGKPSEHIKKGHDDVKRGVQDTSNAATTDETYRQLKK